MGQVASGNYFEVLGLKPRLGRLMQAEDEKLTPRAFGSKGSYPIAIFHDSPGLQ